MIVFLLSSHSKKSPEAEKNIEECNKLIEDEENNTQKAQKPSILHLISYFPLISIILICIIPYQLNTDFVRFVNLRLCF